MLIVDKMSRRPPPKIVVEEHEGYRTIIQSGIIGGHRPGFIEYVVYTDEVVTNESLSTVPPDPTKVTIKRTLQCRLFMTAIEAKNLLSWLTNHVHQYENTYGKIVRPADLGKNTAGKDPPHGMIT